MQIQRINYNTQPTFGLWRRNVIVPSKGIVNRNDTRFFRDDFFFHDLTRLLSEKFKDVSKVNVYCYGCSDGSEPFSFAMSMLTSQEEKNPQKFLPIVAKDIDPVAIEKIVNNNYEISNDERSDIKFYTYGQYKRFFIAPYDDSKTRGLTPVFVKDELYDSVDFGLGDIFEDYKGINPKNTVVMARNFWPYVEDHRKVEKFLKDLYNHLESGSFFVTGEYDHLGIAYKLGDFKRDITRAGFKPTYLKYVYVKE